MKRIHTCDNIVIAGQIQSLLENRDIECFIKNAALAGGIGELPPIECWPEIWIKQDEDESDAKQIIQTFFKQQTEFSNEELKNWQCHCGETIEGQFSQCWNCGAIRN